ncbi:unnamed protein product [Lepeophtheirus salmonis]|uniref:(salmon louse) hypothetical protein n=1 Tax=Lepeophtheirus salmonis TaxID=72036 RepID=A0A7R8CP95_LEPSM|nr:unnamed protein product [Lepeophtheirus salmonis]CAF2837748.1 unnamed protein product [Lepeophtheirus salmonis]
MLGKEDPNAYTEIELHAEICYAELLLLKAILTICEDESLVSFVNAGLKVRSCYHSYRNCISILQDRDWKSSNRVTKILKFIGLNGDRDAGFRDLHHVYEDRESIRQFASCIFLLGYHLVVSYFLGISKPNLELWRLFPLFFHARYFFLQGELEKAIKYYIKSVTSQEEWPQFHHVCYWELFWATSFKRDWRASYNYANILFNESRWSKCFYAYQRAALMCMFEDDLSPEERKEQIDLMKNIPSWKQRLGGKSLPMEKFALSKAERFLKQGNRLTLPVLELIYVWNGFRIIGPRRNLLEPIYVMVEKELKEVETRKGSDFYNEDLCLLTLLKGMCLKYLSSPYGAEECFETVASYGKKLTADSYLIPYSLAERGFLLHELGHGKKALPLFESAKNDFKSYQLQSRLHFRIHSIETEIKKKNSAI